MLNLQYSRWVSNKPITKHIQYNQFRENSLENAKIHTRRDCPSYSSKASSNSHNHNRWTTYHTLVTPMSFKIYRFLSWLQTTCNLWISLSKIDKSNSQPKCKVNHRLRDSPQRLLCLRKSVWDRAHQTRKKSVPRCSGSKYRSKRKRQWDDFKKWRTASLLLKAYSVSSNNGILWANQNN